MKTWKHLTFEQRKVISNGISHNYKLKEIAETLDEAISTSHLPITNETININKLLVVMESGKAMTATEIMEKLGIKSKETLRWQYLDPDIKQGLVSLTITDKPTSKNLMYYKINLCKY